MIDLKDLRKTLIHYVMSNKGYYLSIGISDDITIKRKKKMILEQTTNGKIRTVRKSIIKIEIIE